MHVLTLGDIKHDTFVELPDASLLCKKHEQSCMMCFSYGEKIPVGAFFSQIAGTAPNVAIGLTKLGHTAGVMSSIGTDYDGDRALDFLREHNVETALVVQKKTHRMTHAVVLNYRGESTQLVAHNDTRHQFPRNISPPDLFHIAEISNGYRAVFKDVLTFCKKNQTPLSINPGVVQIQERSKELFALIRECTILFVNLREASLLANSPASITPKKLLTTLLALGPSMVVITDGKKGAYASNGPETFFAPCFPAHSKEATGAGDAFSCGVLGALLHKRPLAEALVWGSVNAASVVEYIGPTAGLLSSRDILRRLREQESYHVQTL